MFLALPLEAGVIVLWEHDGGRDVLFDLADEVEPGALQQLLPAVHRAHLGLHCLPGCVLGLNHTIAL